MFVVVLLDVGVGCCLDVGLVVVGGDREIVGCVVGDGAGDGRGGVG